ncbi:MAG: glycosyltransferase [Candidatus Nanopelagicaceae bacterium]|nr:glycosyltransferase [Candidatus Nanopelagicaceae bacterium]
MDSPKRVLFFAEAVTLAHVARPVALARGLDPARYEVVMACDSRYQHFLERESWQTQPLHSISSYQFLQALARGNPVYDTATLRGYVREDIKLIEQIKPDLIVGDFRLSLSVSARLVGIPYTAITNAYWSPHYAHKGFPLPVLPMTRFLPLPVAEMLFRLARPLAFGLHCIPLNRVRQENGLPSLGTDLRRVYTDADCTLYADIPELFPTENLPTTHHYLGPILWSPPVAKPAWWDGLPPDKPVVYLTLGSSGQARLLPTVLEALGNLPVTVIVATAGAAIPQHVPTNVYIANYLPGTETAARAKLVICNGGSPTSQQALAAGVPVLGIASNMDQFLNMGAVVEAGAGVLLRADRLDAGAVRAAVTEMFAVSVYADSAARLAAIFAHYPASERFAAIAGQLVRPR